MFEISGDDLINIVNQNISEDSKKINSKFSIVIATSKRARQLINDDPEGLEHDNALTVAIDEFKNQKVTIVNSKE